MVGEPRPIITMSPIVMAMIQPTRVLASRGVLGWLCNYRAAEPHFPDGQQKRILEALARLPPCAETPPETYYDGILGKAESIGPEFGHTSIDVEHVLLAMLRHKTLPEAGTVLLGCGLDEPQLVARIRAIPRPKHEGSLAGLQIEVDESDPAAAISTLKGRLGAALAKIRDLQGQLGRANSETWSAERKFRTLTDEFEKLKKELEVEKAKKAR